MTSSFLVAAASALPITFIPPFAADKGLEMSSLGYLVAIAGMIRDITGSYVGGFYIFGTCSIVGGLLLLVKPFVSVQN
uniref:Uncharacterized protein n=1 Tax=Magallana gigas TaxID=29159 RepID=K1QN04_MAGGI